MYLSICQVSISLLDMYLPIIDRCFLVAQMVKNLPAMWEIRVRSLSWENPLEKEWELTPVFLPGKFHGQRSLGGYSPWGRKESDTTEPLSCSIIDI